MIRAILKGVTLLQVAIAMSMLPAHSQSIQQAPQLSVPSDQGQSSAQTKEPKPELERPTVWGEPTEVSVLVYVIDVNEIDAANQTFSASVYVQARWKIPALRHKGPGPLYRSLGDVWNPRLTIVNLQQQSSAFPNVVEISPDGEVTYRQKIWGRFSQPLNLQNFPFDRQLLDIHLAAVGLNENEVNILPLKLEHGRGAGIGQRFSVPDFSVVSWKAKSSPYIVFKGAPGTAGFLFQMEMARSPLYYLVKIIVPLCLIIMMSWAPYWIDPNRVQLTSDGHKAYLEAVEGAFGGDVDYAMLVKLFGAAPESAKGRYSPAECTGIRKTPIEGSPDPAHISTSFAERQNLTMRMQMRRFTRLTNAFSKKFENHTHMVAIYTVWYNYVKQHKGLKGLSPAMAAGLSDTLWSMSNLAEMIDSSLPKPGKRGPYRKGLAT